MVGKVAIVVFAFTLACAYSLPHASVQDKDKERTGTVLKNDDCGVPAIFDGFFAHADPATDGPAKPVPSGPTGVKPQSKTWFAHGSWWAALGATEGLYLWRFDGKNLAAQTVPGVLPHSKKSDACDVLVSGEHLHVLAHATNQRLYKLRWHKDAYQLLDGFPLALSLGGETSTVTQDSTGRLWVAADNPTKDKRRQVRVVWSEPKDHLRWDLTGAVLEEGISPDDICAVTAFGGNRIGVFWSDQVRDRFGFRVHHDGKAPEDWDTLEVVVQAKGIADDHVNLAVDGKGQVWAVTKDAKDRFTVWRRSTAGQWDLRAPVPHKVGTRPIILVSETSTKVHVVYSDWTVTPRTIAMRTSPLDKVQFGDQITVFSGPASWNDVSGPKHAVDDKHGFLLVARSSAGEVRGVLAKP